MYVSSMSVAALPPDLEVTLLHPSARVPVRTRAGDAAYDLFSVERSELKPGARRTIPTGVAVALPFGVAGLVIPRSGLAARHGVSVVNAPGLIDPNYRGEIGVVLINLGSASVEVSVGDRVAQLLLVQFWAPPIAVADQLPPAEDDRGVDGFGSSGR